MDIRKENCLSGIFAMACVVMLLAGCGEEETLHTEAGVQTEEGTLHTEASVQAEEAGNEAGQVVDTPGSEEDKSADSSSAGSVERQTNASKAQMEIDEETRRELTEELLEEAELDTSVMTPKRTTTGCSFDIPEGFAESEEVSNMYVTKRYPIDASTIYYVALDGDISLQLLTQENFKEQTEADLKQAYGEDVEVVLDSFEHVRISGYPAFRILCRYKVDGIEITQLAYAINADKSYMITYSQTGDYDYMEAYEASAATIQVN